MRRIGSDAVWVFLAAFVAWFVIWYLPAAVSGIPLSESGLTFDLFRYYDAATCVVTEACLHAEMVNNPIPVFFAAALLPFSVLTVAAVQCALFAILASRLLNTVAELGVRRGDLLVGILAPSLLMFVAMPSKEFFSICATITCVDYVLRRRFLAASWGDLLLLLFAATIAAAARLAFLIYPIAICLSVFGDGRKRWWLALGIAVMLILAPKDIEHFQALNEEVPSHSSVMQSFRELSASDSVLTQAVLTPIRALFYLIFPFPLLSFSGFGLPANLSDLGDFYAARMLAVESITCLWFVAFVILRLPNRRVPRGASVNPAVHHALASMAVMSVLFIAAASPLPQARYRVSSLVVMGFLATLRQRARSGVAAATPASRGEYAERASTPLTRGTK